MICFGGLTTSSKVSIDPLPANGFPRALQGQEFSNLSGNVGRNEPIYLDLLSGFGASGDPSHPSLVDQMIPVAHPWPVMPSNLSLNILDNNTNLHMVVIQLTKLEEI